MASLQGAERSFRSEESFKDLERLHPMWILLVAALMEMKGPPLPHQVLMALMSWWSISKAVSPCLFHTSGWDINIQMLLGSRWMCCAVPWKI